MDLRDPDPDFAAIEGHIRRANAARSAYLGRLIGEAIAAFVRAAGRFAHRPAAGEKPPVVVRARLQRPVARY